MLRYALLLVFLLSYTEGACPSLSSVYNPSKVNCPQCSFYPAANAFTGSGNKRKLACPGNYEVWYYSDKGQEFVAPVRALGAAYVQCTGSKWQLVAGGRTTNLRAIACSQQ